MDLGVSSPLVPPSLHRSDTAAPRRYTAVAGRESPPPSSFGRVWHWFKDELVEDADHVQGKKISSPSFSVPRTSYGGGMGAGFATVLMVGPIVAVTQAAVTAFSALARTYRCDRSESPDKIEQLAAREVLWNSGVKVLKAVPALIVGAIDLSFSIAAFLVQSQVFIICLRTLSMASMGVIAPLSFAISGFGIWHNLKALWKTNPHLLKKCEKFELNLKRRFDYDDAKQAAEGIGDSVTRGQLEALDRQLWNQDFIEVARRRATRNKVHNAITLIRNVGSVIAMATTAAMVAGGVYGLPVTAVGVTIGGGAIAAAFVARTIFWGYRRWKRYQADQAWKERLAGRVSAVNGEDRSHLELWQDYQQLLSDRKAAEIHLKRANKRLYSVQHNWRRSAYNSWVNLNGKAAESSRFGAGIAEKATRKVLDLLIDPRWQPEERMLEHDIVTLKSDLQDGQGKLDAQEQLLDSLMVERQGYTTCRMKQKELRALLEMEQSEGLADHVEFAWDSDDGWDPTTQSPRPDATATEMMIYFFFEKEVQQNMRAKKKNKPIPWTVADMRDLYLRRDRWSDTFAE